MNSDLIVKLNLNLSESEQLKTVADAFNYTVKMSDDFWTVVYTHNDKKCFQCKAIKGGCEREYVCGWQKVCA